jgi:hypothetical protein
LKGIIVSDFHSSSAFTVILASNFKSIEDLDNFGEIVHSKNRLLAILNEILYFDHFLLAVITMIVSSHSDMLIS